MQEKYNEFRNKYPKFIYENYNIEFDKDYLNITYTFNIPNLTIFKPVLKINRKYITNDINKDYLNYLVFQIGLIEIISYVKCTCSKNIEIKCNYVSEEQINFLKKLYFNGLGEFLYTNQINTSIDDLFLITCTHEKIILPHINYKGNGNLICVGGGKDSCVSLELLKNEKNNSCFIINPKKVNIECSYTAGYNDSDIIVVDRVLDKKIIELNNKGFLNGHTPFSSIVAFISLLVAYLSGKENIILSNESSSNEPTVLGTKINHQYSKTYEFEKDFTSYVNKFNSLDIHYFSLLRGLSEYNIARIFSKYKKYHKVFKSCNVGSKKNPWEWCCECPKCLFVYIILSPFLTKSERIEIFGSDLYDKKELLDTFKELLGVCDTKPFECVGTFEEVRLCVSLCIKNNEQGFLLNYYKENYPLYLDKSLIEKYNEENNLNEYFNTLVTKELKNV